MPILDQFIKFSTHDSNWHIAFKCTPKDNLKQTFKHNKTKNISQYFALDQMYAQLFWFTGRKMWQI